MTEAILPLGNPGGKENFSFEVSAPPHQELMTQNVSTSWSGRMFQYAQTVRVIVYVALAVHFSHKSEEEF